MSQQPAAEAVEVRFVGHLEKLEVGPNDRFVLTLDQPITREIRQRIAEAWREFSAAPLIILDAGMKLGVIDVTVAELAEGKAP